MSNRRFQPALLGAIFVLLGGLSGCALFQRHVADRKQDPIELASYEEQDGKTLHVVGHGWHTGLVVRVEDISPDIWPEIRDFDDMQYVELGWGDEGFYRAKKITAPLVLRAAFWPTPSVMHVAGFRGSVKDFYQVSDIVEIDLSDDEFQSMCRLISSSFARDESGESNSLGPGLYGESRFYRANGKYYLPKTCNIWTAKALKSAGCPVIPQVALRAENVLSQSRRFGTVVQSSPRGLKKAALRGTE